MNINYYFSKDQRLNILNAIREAELKTSGEIRVHLEKRSKPDLIERTRYVFQKLGMHETRLRNGVLFYIAILDKKFAVYGDEGINEVVPDQFWREITIEMQNMFQKGDVTAGICQGIHRVGEQLKIYFPYEQDDENELPDDISTE